MFCLLIINGYEAPSRTELLNNPYTQHFFYQVPILRLTFLDLDFFISQPQIINITTPITTKNGRQAHSAPGLHQSGTKRQQRHVLHHNKHLRLCHLYLLLFSCRTASGALLQQHRDPAAVRGAQ